MFLAFSASSSNWSMSGPKILRELSPLIPDNASITLSRMFCEKFHTMPGMSALQVGVHRVHDFAFRPRRVGPQIHRRQPVAGTSFGQSFWGRSGTKYSPL